MKKCILYGAGVGLDICVNELDEDECQIMAVIDDYAFGNMVTIKEKQVEISKVLDIEKLEYDYIIITIGGLTVSPYEIRQKLIDEYKVTADKIIVFYRKMFDKRISVLKRCAEQIKIHNIIGNTAELGVWKGDFSKKINEIFSDRKIYLFDTFEGFDSQDTSYDNNKAYSNSMEKTFEDTSVDVVINKMPFPEQVIIKKGYFPESLNGLEDKYCFVNIDVDLYKPIKAGLEYFYPRLVKGGYIFIHDYHSSRYQGTKVAVDEFCTEFDITIVPLNDIGGTVIISK